MNADMWSYNPESSYTPGTRLIGFKVDYGNDHSC